MSRSKFVKTLAVIAILGMVAAACSKPKSAKSSLKATKATVPDVSAPVTAAPDTSTTAAPAAAKKSTSTKAATTAGRTLTGGGDDAQAKLVGAQIHPISTTRGPKPYASGVGDDTVQLDFSYDKTICGVNAVTALTAAGGALPSPTRYYRKAAVTPQTITAENEESVDVMVKYWNAHAFDSANYAPNIRNLMGNDPEHQFFGRKLVYKMIDGGSNQCPDKTSAAATEAAETDHAFVVFNNYDGAQYNMAADLNAVPAGHRPMHFGTLWLSDQDYSRFAPFAWTQFSTGSTITREWASYVCSRLVGGKASRSPDAATQQQPRVFGLLHTNLPQDKKLAAEFNGYLTQYCGNKNPVTKEIEYDGTDFSNASSSATNVMLQMKTAGVTSILMLTDPIQPLFQTQAAKNQSYYPEWIWSSYGFGDSSTVQRIYDASETAGDFGTSNLGVYGGFGFGSGDPFWMYHSEHLKSPDGQDCDPSSDAGMSHDEQYCKAPDALVTWYYTMLPLIGGMLFAGPDLTPQNVSAGLQSYPTTRYGGNGPTSDPRPALVGAGKDKYGFVVDAVEWRWHPEYTSPPPEAKAKGWVEYPDCMRHYLTWPDQLAPNWEKDGPNYNNWCGDPKTGYPKVLDSDKQ
jgi:hypothetical protein